MLHQNWRFAVVYPKPLGHELITKLAISNTGDAPRCKISELGGPKETTVAGIIVLFIFHCTQFLSEISAN